MTARKAVTARKSVRFRLAPGVKGERLSVTTKDETTERRETFMGSSNGVGAPVLLNTRAIGVARFAKLWPSLARDSCIRVHMHKRKRAQGPDER